MEHEWLRERCIEVQNEPDERLDLWAREHYKSTIITFGKTIQDILASHGDEPLIDRELCFGIFSHTRPIAKGFMRQIKRELEANEYLKDLFPDVLYQFPQKQAPKWSEDDGLVVKRKSNPKESTVESWGLVDGQPTSKHFPVMVFDDVVTIESARSADMIRKTTEALEIAYNLGTDGGSRRFVGTIYDDQDTYSTIMERKTAIPRIYPATHDGTATGKAVFMSDEKLAQKLRDMGVYTFSCQMLLDPVPADNAFFTKEQFIIEDDLPDNFNVYGCSDYAVTEDGGDYTEHGVFGLDSKGRPWVFDWWTGQTKADVWIDSQLDLCKKWQPHVWVGETGPIRRSVEPFLEHRMQERKEYVLLKWLPTVGDKASRCRSFQAMAEIHGIRMIRANWNQPLVSQLCRFPKSTIDDKADVCGLFGRALREVWAARVPDVDETAKNRDYGFSEDDEEENWRMV